MRYLNVVASILFLLSAILITITYCIRPSNLLVLISAICFWVVVLLRIPIAIQDVKEIKQHRKKK